MILVEDFEANSNINEVTELIESINQMVKEGTAGNEAIIELEGIIKKLPRRNSKFIKAKKKVLLPISKLKNSVADFNNNMSIVRDNLSDFIK